MFLVGPLLDTTAFYPNGRLSLGKGLPYLDEKTKRMVGVAPTDRSAAHRLHPRDTFSSARYISLILRGMEARFPNKVHPIPTSVACTDYIVNRFAWEAMFHASQTC